MDDRLRLLQYLYDEDVDEASIARHLAEDEELFREYQRLREAKRQLDECSSRRPDPAVVDQVVDTARAAAQAPDSASPAVKEGENDRPPRAPGRSWTDRLHTASAALAVLLLVGFGWWQGGGVPDLSGASAPDALAERARPAGAAAEPGTRAEAVPAEAVPAWDDSDEVVRIHRRIERLQAHSAPGRWGSTLQRVDRR